MGHVAAHVALVHPQGEALVHRGPDVHQVPGRPVHADDRHVAALAHRLDRPVDRHRNARCMKLFPKTRCSLLPSASIPTASITTSGPPPSNWSFRQATTSGTSL